VKGWGEPFLGRGEKRNGEKLNKTVSFDHFLDMYGRKTLKKIALMTHLGLFLSLFTYFLRFSHAIYALFRKFSLIFLLYNASDERVGGSLFYGRKGPLIILTCFELWATVFLGRCPFGQKSSGQMSPWANVFLGKCLLWANVFWANVFWANVLMGKHLYNQALSGQMSPWANVVWANVSK
jgi:hypothetical protein